MLNQSVETKDNRIVTKVIHELKIYCTQLLYKHKIRKGILIMSVMSSRLDRIGTG